MKKYFIFMVLLVLMFGIGSVCAEDTGDNSTALEVDDDSVEADTADLDDNENEILKDNNVMEDETDSSDLSTTDDSKLKDSSEVIVVNNWDELRKYALKADKNYVVKLKENTNFYPSSPTDKSCQIKVKNNLTIIGSEGAYFGDICQRNAYIKNGHQVVEGADPIKYTPIVVPDDSKIGITLENVTFQWIYTNYQPDGLFLQMGGNTNNYIRNCVFKNINTYYGHSSIVYIKRGEATLENCSFINCTTDFGCVSIYDPSVPETSLHSTARMLIKNCYFENNFARTEPGAINNCGLVIVYNTTFIKNRASVWAGAIHTHGGANTTLYNCEFIDNVAGWNGGALYTYSYLQIFNSTFRGNNCTTNNGGGAIGACAHLTTPHIFITDSLFENNANNCWSLDELSTTGTGRGGAISFMDAGSLEVRNSLFIANSASIGTAICAIEAGSYGSPTVIIDGNTFINHNRQGDVLNIRLAGTKAYISNNKYYNNSIEFENISFSVSEPVDKKVTITINSQLKNPSYYDPDILDKCKYSIYVDGKYKETINGTTFTLNFEDIETCKFYVVPSIYNGKSEEVTLTFPRDYIYVSKEKGKDTNNGLKNTPVYSLSKAIELAKNTENIILLDGVYCEENLLVDYRLTIWGTDKSSIGKSTVNNCMFNVKNSKFSLRNITINDLSMADESSRFIKGDSNRIYLTNCIIQSNTFNTFIDSSALGITDTNLKNNKISLNTKNLTITSSNFSNNTADSNAIFKSNSNGNDWNVVESNFTNNNGLIMDYSSKSGKLNILNSIFKNNSGTSQSSCIKLDDLAKLNVESTIFLNNDNNLPIIFTNANVGIVVRNSIILNNTMGNMIIGGNIGNVDCNYNWWGNTLENANIAPNSLQGLENWLFLKISNPNYVEHGKEYVLDISLNNLITKENITSTYKSYKLPSIMLLLNGENITVNKKHLNLTNGKSNVKFTLNGLLNGSFSARHENIITTVKFNFIKSVPARVIQANEIFVGDIGHVEITLPDDATGNITIMINNTNKGSKKLENSKVSFDLKNLNAGEYNLSITYSGDDKYLSFDENIPFIVNKYESNIKINVGDIEINEDVILTLELPNDATGNATLFINNNPIILDVENSRRYTIKNITRGDWIIKAIYYGDSKYLSSEDYTKLAVAKFDADMIINLFEIDYGEDAETQIIMRNNDATGNVTIIIDDKNKTEQLSKGRATIVISNLTAGYKNVFVKYSGDQNYNEKTYSSRFYINQIPTHFNITTTGALEGKNSIVELEIPEGVEGCFTISVGDITDVVDIPKYGQVSWVVSTLPAGTYTVTVTYNGQNYKTCKNQAQLTVYPWKNTQWPNMGYDSQNSGKSPYNSNTNGELKWAVEITESIIGNIAIDSEGNICIITPSGIYSFSSNGSQNWKHNSYSTAFSGIAVGRDVIVSPVSGDTLYFINQTYGQRYGYSNIWQGSSVFAPVLDGKCNVYISGEKIYDTGKYNLVIVPYSIWEYGGQVISIDLGDNAPTTAPVVVSDNIVCVGTQDGLKLIDVSQEKVISTLNIMCSVRPVVGDGGIIYALTADELVAIGSTGLELWKSNITGGEAKYLAIDNEHGLVYSINAQGNLYKYDIFDNGAETLISSLKITSGILIGNDGALYFGADNIFVAMDSNGKYLWKCDIAETIIGTPVMDEDGTIYVYGNNTLFALTNAPLKDVDLKINTNNVSYGGNVKIMVSLNKEVTGKIVVEINNNTYDVNVNEGVGKITIPHLPADIYPITVKYAGDGRYSASVKYLTVSVSKAEIPASEISIPSEIKTYAPSFSIDLPDDATGSLIVSVDGKQYSSELKNGKATVNIPKLTSGKHTITVTYTGDNSYDSITASKTVVVPLPKITEYKNVVMDYSDGSAYKVRVLGIDGKPVSGEFVTFKINKKTIKAKTNKNGYASVKITEIPKKYTITATYNEITVKNTVTVKQILKSGNYKVKKSAKKLVLKATLKSSKGKAIKGKKITFKLNGKTYKANTNKKGIAKLTIKKNVIKKLKVKKYTLQITYLKNTIKKTLSVKK